MSKAFWAIIAVIIVVFGGIIVFQNNKASAPGGQSAEPTNHVTGEGKSGVVLVEYGDYQCSACYQYEPVIKQVIEKYNEQITFQFRNLPLLQIHPNAVAAARAAEAASLQDKFWEMHDLLFQNQPVWQGASNAQTFFEQYAQQLNLDLERFKTDAASSAVNDTINADVSAFNETGQQKTTPTFFLDGKKINVNSTLESFSGVIDEAIANKTTQ